MNNQPNKPSSSGVVKKIPQRPSKVACAGRPISLSVNHFALKQTLDLDCVYHYDVDVKGAEPKSKPPPAALKKDIVAKFICTDQRFKDSIPVYDFRNNIFTIRKILGPNGRELEGSKVFPFEYVDPDTRTNSQYKIQIKPAGQVAVDLAAIAKYLRGGSSLQIPSQAVQALEIAMKYGYASRPGVVPAGRSLFRWPDQGKIVSLGSGAQVYFGHFQSLRLTSQMILNVDSTQRAFAYSGNVANIMASIYNKPVGVALRDWEYTEFGKTLANLKVVYPTGEYDRKVACNGLSRLPANRESFDFNGRRVTVQQFFEDKLKRKLLYPNLPCVWIGPRNKRAYVPMELCTIPPGQEYKRQLMAQQTSNMIRIAALPANERKQRILDAVKAAKFNEDPTFRALGINVDEKMVQVKGRVLPAPSLVYDPQQTFVIEPLNGSWNLVNKAKFVASADVGPFGVFSTVGDGVTPGEIQAFMAALGRCANEKGMQFSPAFQRFVRQTSDVASDLRRAQENVADLKTVFVIIRQKGDPNYEIVKQVGDLELHLVTQCVQMKNIKRIDPQITANICLKLNAKLGGINNLIKQSVRPKVLNEQVIIMGADVTHPSAIEGKDKPSIAAVVGSIDPSAYQYCAEVRVQPPRQETIEGMADMVHSILLKYHRVTGATSTGKPQRIIFFRDGVSEGQFAEIIEKEVHAIQVACQRLEDGYRPPITFVVVQKRHHTRLFPNDPKDETGKAKNVPPGTVVDVGIVHPTENDFYLVSHFGIQGTSRPCHYHVLWDDNQFSADDLQKLTYHLCYMFSRCTRSVSYPAPCYYAHLLAFRGRQYHDSLRRTMPHVSSQEIKEKIARARDMPFMFFA